MDLGSFIVSFDEVKVDVSRFFDLSHVIENGMPVYPGDPEPSVERVLRGLQPLRRKVSI